MKWKSSIRMTRIATESVAEEVLAAMGAVVVEVDPAAEVGTVMEAAAAEVVATVTAEAAATVAAVDIAAAVFQ